MVRSNATNELELVFDRMTMEYPALVKETFISVGRDELSDNCASMADGYCWLISKQNVFVWKASKDSGALKRAAQLPLPPSGLLYSARSVIVYKTGPSTPPGVLVVSGEGVTRHWPSAASAFHSEAILDLSSEVALCIQLLEHPCGGYGASFVLTTTSGSVYFIRSEAPRGTLQWQKVGSREGRGIGRRLSSIIFGSHPTAPESSRVITSLLLWRESEEITDDDEVARDPLVVVVSPMSLTLFDIKNKSILWTVNIKTLIEGRVKASFERISRGQPIKDIDVWLLDAAQFRGGLLLLLAASHENASQITFFLALLRDFDFHAPVDAAWFSAVPGSTNNAQHFDIADDSSFVGRLFLCIPDLTANSSRSERTDGVLIIHSHFVQSVYPPDQLDRHNELPLNKITLLPGTDKMVGHACDNRYCYVMMIDGGISTVRLLPKGFDDGSVDDSSFMQLLPDIMPSGDDALESLLSAFTFFASKNIVEACVAMQPLLLKSDNELATLVYVFLSHVIDHADGESLVETELRNKKAICNRIVLFLRHMGVFERVSQAKVVISSSRNSRSGASLLAEMSERVMVTLAVRSWQTSNEDHSEAICMVGEKMAKIIGHKGEPESILFGKLSIIHLLPQSLVACVRSLLSRSGSAQLVKSARLELLYMGADLLLTYANAIEACRRSVNGVLVSVGDAQWTTGHISDAYLHMCKVLIAEMQSTDVSNSEKNRLRDFVVRHAVFHLGECDSNIDGHEIIVSLYDLGEYKVAVDLAERFKDFKVLVKVCLEFDGQERRTKLDLYKQRFAADDFDLYLCQYLKQRNLNELLLEERGERIDRYLLSCDGIRWRRELQKHQYVESSNSLLSLADREVDDLRRQKALYSLAKLAAICAEPETTSVIKEADRKLNLIQHQQEIPQNIIKNVFPDNPSRPLTAAEMIELNMIDTVEDMDAIDGYLRAICLLGSLLEECDSPDLRSHLVHVWTSAVKRDDWTNVKSASDAASSTFGLLLRAVLDNDWPLSTKTLVMPPSDTILKECAQHLKKNGSAEKWIRKGAEKARLDLRDQQSGR